MSEMRHRHGQQFVEDCIECQDDYETARQAEVARLQARVAELDAVLREIDSYVQHAGQDVQGEWIHRKVRTVRPASSDWLARHDAEVRRAALESCAKVAEAEADEYRKSVREQDVAGHHETATAECRAVLACERVATAIRALASPAEAVKP
jgi:hypothetical protein